MRNPSDVSFALRTIAAKLENSNQPSIVAVKKDLNAVLVDISPYRRACRRMAAQLVLLAAGDEMDDATKKELIDFAKDKRAEDDISKDMAKEMWDSEAAKELKTSWGTAESARTEDILKRALKNVSEDAMDFIRDLEGKKTKRQERRDEGDEDVFTSAPRMR
jgi:hypothetical protein